MSFHTYEFNTSFIVFPTLVYGLWKLYKSFTTEVKKSNSLSSNHQFDHAIRFAVMSGNRNLVNYLLNENQPIAGIGNYKNI